MQLEQYALNAGVVNQDPAKRARSLESATKLKTLLHQFFEKSFEKHADPGPPFEKPNIVHILMMFLDLKFPRGSAHRPIAETVTQQLVHEINIFELQSPASNRTPIHPTPGYQALFRRWELMVKANAQIKEAKYRTSDVFGKFILRSLVRDIQNHFTNNLYATDPQGLSFVTSYFGELEKVRFLEHRQCEDFFKRQHFLTHIVSSRN